MDLRIEASESRFSAYVEGLASVIGHADRAKPLWDYCVGLMLPCERKSVEPMAAVTAPARTAAQRQSLLHFVGEGRWSDERGLAKVREIARARRPGSGTGAGNTGGQQRRQKPSAKPYRHCCGRRRISDATTLVTRLGNASNLNVLNRTFTHALDAYGGRFTERETRVLLL